MFAYFKLPVCWTPSRSRRNALRRHSMVPCMCSTLDLSYSGFNQDIPWGLWSLSNLVYVNLANNDFTGDIIATVGSLPHIQYVASCAEFLRCQETHGTVARTAFPSFAACPSAAGISTSVTTILWAPYRILLPGSTHCSEFQ